MDNNSFFFVNVFRRLVCVVYFVIVPVGYTLLYSLMKFKVCSIHISACHRDVAKWTKAAAREFKRTETLSKYIPKTSYKSENNDKVASS